MANINIFIDKDEEYPVYYHYNNKNLNFKGDTYVITQAQFEKWDRIRKEYDQMQRELKKLYTSN